MEPRSGPSRLPSSVGRSTGVGKLWQELLQQGAVQHENLVEQVSTLHKEMLAQGAAQKNLLAGLDDLRREAVRAVREEREARWGETHELHTALYIVQARLTECEAASKVQLSLSSDHKGVAISGIGTALPRDEASVASDADLQRKDDVHMTSVSLAGISALDCRVHALAQELEAEQESRCAKIADLHARLGREMADVSCHLEEQRRALEEDIALLSFRMEEQHVVVEKNLTRERNDRCRESLDLRGILESVWQKSASTPASPNHIPSYFKHDGESQEGDRVKEFVGDRTDINSLYAIMKDSVGETVHLRQQINEEQQNRDRDISEAKRHLERLERQVITLQALVRESQNVASSSSVNLSAPPKVPL